MDPTLWPLAAATLSGALVGFLLSVFGGGGSVLAAPLLIYVVGVTDPHVAIGTSAAAVAVNAVAGLATHARAGRVKWPCAIVFGLTGVIGSVAGSTFAKHVDGHRLLFLFALAMAAVAIAMLRPKAGAGDPTVTITPARALKLAPLGLLTGLGAGFFGIGGGFLIAPGLMASTGMTLAHAQASSLLSVALFGSATAANYAVSGLVDWPVFWAMLAGGAAGTLAGIPAARALASRAVLGRRLFALLILVVAAYVAARAVSG